MEHQETQPQNKTKQKLLAVETFIELQLLKI